MEYLSRCLSGASLHKKFNFHPKYERLKLSHLAFPNDLMIFTRGDYLSVCIMCEALTRFGMASGLRAKSLASSIFLAGVDDYERNTISNSLVIAGSMPFRYLSIPLSGVYFKVPDYSPLLQKVANILLTWAGLNLSYVGSLEVICSVVHGIKNFWLGVLPVSTVVLDRITGLCRRFIWGSNSTKVAWNTKCLDKQQGGLGLRDTRKWNDALLTKALWSVHAKKDTLCVSGFTITMLKVDLFRESQPGRSFHL